MQVGLVLLSRFLIAYRGDTELVVRRLASCEEGYRGPLIMSWLLQDNTVL